MATHWKKLAHQDYIGAWALSPGEDLTVTVKKVSRQNIVMAGGKSDERPVASLDGYKPLVLNATNAKTMQRLYGPYIEDWAGKQITLYASTTQLAGEVVECLRIRPTVPGPKPKPTLSEARFPAALESIREGRFTASKLIEQYDLTPEQVAQLHSTPEVPSAQI